MGYDKKHIKNANKQGLFDSSLDPSVLSMDAQEKKELAKKLQQSVESAESSSANDVKASAVSKKKSVKEQLSVWERFLLFIEKLFMGVSEDDFVKSRELRKIAADVKKYKPPLINPANNRLTPQFCEMIYKLAAQMAGFKSIYKRCQAFQVKPGADTPSFAGYFVEQMGDDMESLSAKLNYTYIKNNQALFNDKNFKKTIETEINRYLSGISHEQRQMINLYYANLLGYERLCDFNFFTILRKFGEQYTNLSMAYPEFASVPGELLVYELQQLEDLLYAIDTSIDMAFPFEIVLRYYEMVSEDSEESSWEMADFKKMLDTMQLFLREERLVNIVRLLAGAPSHTPKIRSRQVSLIDEYRQELAAKFIPYCRALVHQVEVDNLNIKIKALFGSEALSSIEFYSESTNKRLAELELPIFENCSYLQIIKTYYERLFQPLIKPSLNVVVVDGDFFDKQLYSKLSDFFYKFPDVYAAIADFERKVSSSDKEGKKLQELFRRITKDVSSRKVVADKIYYLNNLSAKAVRGVCDLLDKTLPALKALQEDALKKAKPVFVLNIRQLGGIRNRAILKAIEKAVEATKLIFEILKDFYSA